LILRPLDLDGYCSSSINPTIVMAFFKEFLKGPLSPQIQFQFIPKLVHQTPASLTPSSILTSLLSKDSCTNPSENSDGTHENDSKEHKLIISGDIWLLYSIVAIISPQLNLMTQQDRFNYVMILKNLAKYLPDESDKNLDFTNDEDDSEPMEVTETDDIFHNLDEGSVAAQIIDLINEASHVNSLISLVDTSSPSKDALIGLSSLCHALLSCNKFALHQYR